MTEIETAWERSKGTEFLREERQVNHPIRKLIVERGVGNTVLDGGCATSVDYPLWKEAGFKYTGIDFTPKFLKRARELYPEINVIGGNLEAIPFGDRCFDSTYLKDIIEHLSPEKYRQVIPELWRVTGNRMMIAFYIAPTDKPTKYELIDNLHYKNHYNKGDILNLLACLDDARIIDMIEEIGYNHSALYIVDRVS